jgi:hypothetical protein
LEKDPYARRGAPAQQQFASQRDREENLVGLSNYYELKKTFATVREAFGPACRWGRATRAIALIKAEARRQVRRQATKR